MKLINERQILFTGTNFGRFYFDTTYSQFKISGSRILNVLIKPNKIYKLINPKFNLSLSKIFIDDSVSHIYKQFVPTFCIGLSSYSNYQDLSNKFKLKSTQLISNDFASQEIPKSDIFISNGYENMIENTLEIETASLSSLYFRFPSIYPILSDVLLYTTDTLNKYFWNFNESSFYINDYSLNETVNSIHINSLQYTNLTLFFSNKMIIPKFYYDWIAEQSFNFSFTGTLQEFEP